MLPKTKFIDSRFNKMQREEDGTNKIKHEETSKRGHFYYVGLFIHKKGEIEEDTRKLFG